MNAFSSKRLGIGVWMLCATFAPKIRETELNEQCPHPWKEYYISGTKSGITDEKDCAEKCAGNAFYTDEGKLVCFKIKIRGKPLPIKHVRNYDGSKCYCGYPSFIGKASKDDENRKTDWLAWQECDPVDRVIFSNGRRGCKMECSRLTIYLHAKNNKKILVHCDNEERSIFYNITGSVGDLSRYKQSEKGVRRFNHRLCGCVVRDDQMNDPPLRNETISQGTLEECGAPWKYKIRAVSKIDLCAEYCQQRCQKGKALRHKGSLLCFQRMVKTRMKRNKSPNEEELCECGHGKRTHLKNEAHTNSYDFMSCDPRKVFNTTSYRACNAFCKNTRAFVTTKYNKILNIRCVTQNDLRLLTPRVLTGKCGKRVYANEKGKMYYMICKCGLMTSRQDQNIETDVSKIKERKYANISRSLPASWLIKRKRSTLKCNKKNREMPK